MTAFHLFIFPKMIFCLPKGEVTSSVNRQYYLGITEAEIIFPGCIPDLSGEWLKHHPHFVGWCAELPCQHYARAHLFRQIFHDCTRVSARPATAPHPLIPLTAGRSNVRQSEVPLSSAFTPIRDNRKHGEMDTAKTQNSRLHLRLCLPRGHDAQSETHSVSRILNASR